MEEEPRYIPDEKLEAMLNRLKKQIPDINCPSGNRVAKLCISPKCAQALRCNDKECGSCGKGVHKFCGSVSLEEITEGINQRALNSRDFVIQLYGIEQQFIEIIRKSQKEFVEKYSLGRLASKHQNLIDKLYTSKEYKIMSGKEAQEICQSLEEGSGSNQQKKMLEQYAKSISKLSEQFCSLKEKYFFSDKILSNLDLKIDSKVLEMKGTMEEDIKFLQKVFNRPKQIKLLFRASQHQFKASQFHAKCDGIEDTLVLVRTEYGKTMGGYTHFKWNQVSSNWVNDAARRAFLLQLDIHEKMPAVQDNHLIQCNSSHGPYFGAGATDLYLSDNCGSNQGSYGKFPSTYNHEIPKEYIYSEEGFKLFCGASNGLYKVIQYEVFQVIFK